MGVGAGAGASTGVGAGTGGAGAGGAGASVGVVVVEDNLREDLVDRLGGSGGSLSSLVNAWMASLYN